MRPSRAKTPAGARTPGGLLGARTHGRTPLRTPARPQPYPGATPSRREKDAVVKDPVEVFCRVRPDDSEEPCIKVRVVVGDSWWDHWRRWPGLTPPR